MGFRFDALSVSADQKAAIVEWAIGSISGLDASGRIRRCGELAGEIGWVDADAGVVLDRWCREGKTMDQARVEAAEKHLAELDSVESGVVADRLVVESPVGGDFMGVGSGGGDERTLEMLREIMGVVDPQLVEARWGWNWEKKMYSDLKSGQWAENSPRGAGAVMTVSGDVVEWKYGAWLVMSADGVVGVTAEGRMSRVKRVGSRATVVWSAWCPKKLKMTRKPGKTGRPKEQTVRLSLESVGMKFLAVVRKWMPEALAGASQADLGRRVGVKRQNIFFHEKVVEERIAAAGRKWAAVRGEVEGRGVEGRGREADGRDAHATTTN